MKIEGYIDSTDLAEKKAMLHKRRSVIIGKVKKIQVELSNMDKDHPDRKPMTNTLNNFIGEQGTINELIKEVTVLYDNSIDQILLDLIKEDDEEYFNTMLDKAKGIYSLNHKPK